MKRLEIISDNGTAEVPMLDEASELLDGLHTVVRSGINSRFNDVVWLYYYGPLEKMTVQSDPGFQRLLQLLESRGVKKEGKDKSHLDILATPDDLATNMAAKGGHGGGFWRVETLDEQRYVIAPAVHVPQLIGQPKEDVPIDITHGITFAGTALTEALFTTGVMAEIIDYRDEPDFPAYRQATLGRFFVDHVLVD